MLASDIISEVREIVQELDTNNAHKTDSAILEDINACTLQLCSTIATLPKSSVTGVTAAATITLSDNLLKLDFASIADGSTPAKHTPLETNDFVNFSRLNPSWQDTQTGRPEQIVRMTDLTWMLWPNPDATWTGKAVTLVGSVLPTPLTSFAQSPAISVVLHPAYVHYCAWKYFLLLNNPERAASSFAAYDTLRKMNTQTATSTRGSLQSLRMPPNF